MTERTVVKFQYVSLAIFTLLPLRFFLDSEVKIEKATNAFGLVFVVSAIGFGLFQLVLLSLKKFFKKGLEQEIDESELIDYQTKAIENKPDFLFYVLTFSYWIFYGFSFAPLLIMANALPYERPGDATGMFAILLPVSISIGFIFYLFLYFIAAYIYARKIK